MGIILAICKIIGIIFLSIVALILLAFLLCVIKTIYICNFSRKRHHRRNNNDRYKGLR